VRESNTAAWSALRIGAAESFGGLVVLVIAGFLRKPPGSSTQQQQQPVHARAHVQWHETGRPATAAVAPPAAVQRTPVAAAPSPQQRRRRQPPVMARRKVSPGRLLAGAGGLFILTVFTYFDFQKLAETGHARVWAPIAWLYYMVGPTVTLGVMATIGVVFGFMGLSQLGREADFDESTHMDFGHDDAQPEETPPHLRRDGPQARQEEQDGRRAA
jgi:hypothetical protein